MKRTSIGALVLLAAIGAIVGGLLESALASAGRPIILPPLTLGIALLVIGVVGVLLAVPIRRLTRGKSHQPIDPFYATRVLILAKASALSGSLLTGFAAGVTIYLLTRSEVPVNSVGPAIATFVGAACLLAGGLIAEHMCTIPPADDDDDDEGRRAIRARP
jgi:predicted membrane protein